MNDAIREKIIQKWKSLRKDPLGVTAYRLDGYINLLNTFWWNFWISKIAWCWGIKIGRQVRFIGPIQFKRFPRSSIRIAENCTFRSDFRSNPIGINRPCYLSTHSPTACIEIGNKCGFSGTIIAAFEKIKIGDNVLCGANTTITDFDWHGQDPENRKIRNQDYSAPIIIENNVWLGLNVVVLKGVTIGANSIIGANSLVTKSIPSNVLAVGQPAKAIRSL